MQLSGCGEQRGKERQSPLPASEQLTISGGNDERVPPVPIPNTEVKPLSAERTWLDTAREHRSPPDSISQRADGFSAFFVYRKGFDTVLASNDCFGKGRGFAPAGATKGLSGRPLETFAPCRMEGKVNATGEIL